MNPAIKNILESVTPPIILKGAKALVSPRARRRHRHEVGSEKGAEWYDASFEGKASWKYHYTQSGYYFLWTVILDRMLRSGVTCILEIGCGPGQLACLMRDKGIDNYHGFDFSPKRLAQAKSVCREFTFSEEDAFETELFETYGYDAVVCTEFLEHVEKDLEILNRIRSGTKFYGTVPNFPFISHVRHFNNESEVIARYAQCFSDLKVDALLANDRGKTFYLLEGRIA